MSTIHVGLRLSCQTSRVATPQPEPRVRSAGHLNAMFGRLPPITTASDIVATSPQINAPSLLIFLTFTVWFSIYIAAAFAAFYTSTWPPPRPSRFTYVHPLATIADIASWNAY